MNKLSFIFLLLMSFDLWAGFDTLPANINSPMFRYGIMSSLEQKYEKDGQLWRLGDLRSIEFDASTLSKISPDAKTLINALDAFGQRHGQFINYGVLKFEINPTIQYFAPVYAYGIKSNWTVAIAMPIITYENEINIKTVNSNLDSYKSVYYGRVSEELDKALTLDIKQETLKTIQQRGYKPLESRRDQYLSDIQLISIFKFFQNGQYDLYYAAQVGLPTGPKYDPDDLAALNIFGQTSVENTLASKIKGKYGFNFTPSMGYQYILPDYITARVPLDENDSLPDSIQKEEVERRTSGKWTFKGELQLEATDSMSFSTSYSQAQKGDDIYSGSANSRYDLLGVNTYSREEKYSLGGTFNTIKSYFKKKALFPYILSYEFSDIFKGENINRRTLHEFSFVMFF